MERISGPFNGFYIAAFASEATGASSSFFAYAKICRGKPDNYWDAHCCAKVAGESLHPTAQAALAEAEGRALRETLQFARVAFAKAEALESVAAH